MRKLRILVCLALAATFFAGLETAAFAATSLYDNASSYVSSHVSSHVSSDMIQPYANDRLNDETIASAREGTLYSENNAVPHTGIGSLAVPGMAALLAAATAAVALTGKKK